MHKRQYVYIFYQHMYFVSRINQKKTIAWREKTRCLLRQQRFDTNQFVYIANYKGGYEHSQMHDAQTKKQETQNQEQYCDSYNWAIPFIFLIYNLFVFN